MNVINFIISLSILQRTLYNPIRQDGIFVTQGNKLTPKYPRSASVRPSIKITLNSRRSLKKIENEGRISWHIDRVRDP